MVGFSSLLQGPVIFSVVGFWPGFDQIYSTNHEIPSCGTGLVFDQKEVRKYRNTLVAIVPVGTSCRACQFGAGKTADDFSPGSLHSIAQLHKLASRESFLVSQDWFFYALYPKGVLSLATVLPLVIVDKKIKAVAIACIVPAPLGLPWPIIRRKASHAWHWDFLLITPVFWGLHCPPLQDTSVKIPFLYIIILISYQTSGFHSISSYIDLWLYEAAVG